MKQNKARDTCVYDDILDDTPIDVFIFILELRF